MRPKFWADEHGNANNFADCDHCGCDLYYLVDALAISGGQRIRLRMPASARVNRSTVGRVSLSGPPYWVTCSLLEPVKLLVAGGRIRYDILPADHKRRAQI